MSMHYIPFLKPKLVPKESYQHYLERIDASRIYTNNGPLNRAFEERILLEYFNNEGAVVTVSNATIGLMLATAQLRRRGKYALMPSFTFPATPLSSLWCGLEPYYIDIDPDHWCMDEKRLEEAIQMLGEEVAVVVPYATFGASLNFAYYESLLQRGIPVVIDGASSFGSALAQQDERGFQGAIVYSFHATKSFGIGEGAIVYSGDQELIQSIRRSANFGFNEQRESKQLGLNGKISEYTAAIGLATLDVFHEKIAKREQIGEWYEEAWRRHKLSDLGWRVQQAKGKVAYQFYPVLCRTDRDNKYYVNKLDASGIQVRTYFSPPCHLHQMFELHPRGLLNITEDISNRIISLPIWEDMEQEQIEHIVRCLANA